LRHNLSRERETREYFSRGRFFVDLSAAWR
jgi:hypothetical protein